MGRQECLVTVYFPIPSSMANRSKFSSFAPTTMPFTLSQTAIESNCMRKVTATPAALSSKVANTRNFGSDRWSKTIRLFGNTWMKTLWFSWFLGRAHES